MNYQDYEDMIEERELEAIRRRHRRAARQEAVGAFGFVTTGFLAFIVFTYWYYFGF